MTKKSDRVLIEPDAAPEKIGNIFIPETAREKLPQGTVVSAGQHSAFKSGYKVIFTKGKGMEIAIHDKAYLLIREDDIYGHFVENGFKPTA